MRRGASGTARAGVHLIESEFVFEVVDPATLEPVAPGTQGELVATNLGRAGMPHVALPSSPVTGWRSIPKAMLGNMWGLARGYAAVGKYQDALKYAKLALPQAPDEQNRKSIEGSIPKLAQGQNIN